MFDAVFGSLGFLKVLHEPFTLSTLTSLVGAARIGPRAYPARPGTS